MRSTRWPVPDTGAHPPPQRPHARRRQPASWSPPATCSSGGSASATLAPTAVPDDAVVIDLGDVTLLPGLMDMEVNLLLGGPDHRSPLTAVQDDPAVRTLRPWPTPAGRCGPDSPPCATSASSSRPGACCSTSPSRRPSTSDGSTARGSCRPVTPSRPTGGHLDPTMFQAFAPHIMPLTVEEGIANGVSEVRKAVRYQIKHGAQVIKVCASGGVMSHTGPAGAQQYSDEELRGHRGRGPPGRPQGGGPRPRRRTASGPPSRPASTASSTAR